MAKKTTDHLDLAVQKLAVEFQYHSKQDEINLKKIDTSLVSINDKLDLIKTLIDRSKTDIAVLENKFENHVQNHEHAQKVATRNATITLTVITIVINIITFIISHSLT